MRISPSSLHTVAAIQTSKIPNFGLTFDHSQNFVKLGTMGTFGSSITANDGFYASFDLIASTASGLSLLGKSNDGGEQQIAVTLNSGGVNGHLICTLHDSAKSLAKHCINTTLTNGLKHTVVITAVLSTHTMTISIDGTAQTIFSDNVDVVTGLVNFTKEMYLGAENANGLASGTMDGLLDNVKLGTSANVLFGSYAMNEGTGTTIADTSGQNNTGTLSGSPLPTWTVIS